jgi:hypothetical protein
LAGLILCSTARADIVDDWNANLFSAAKTAAQLPPLEARIAAIVQIAVFDAVNCIDRRYEPYFVTDLAPQGTRADAAAAGAAYTALKALYPAQAAAFDAELAVSLATLSGGGGEAGASITNGLNWGEHVATLILALRSTDGASGTNAAFFGGTAPGVWRSPPTATAADGTLPAVLPQWPHVTPFAMTSPSQFRPGPPPALTSVEYGTDVKETESLGRVDSTTRTAEQTQLALLWQAVGPVDELGIALSLVPDASLVDKARLLALTSIAFGDGLIAIFDAKYTYNLWRPYHAIRLADTNANPLTVADPTWTSLIYPPPRHQEYPSAHGIATGAVMEVLARELGDENAFTLSSPGYPSFTWTFARFSDAAAQVKEARIWGGLHFRNSVNVGGQMGVTLGDYVVDNVLRPLSTNQSYIDAAVIDPSSTYAGKTYSEWSASWWQYLMGLPTTNNPLLHDPAHPVISMSTGQHGPVWFTGGDFGGKGPKTQNYTNTVPGGVALFLGIESFEWDNADCPNPDTATPAQLLANIMPEENRATNIICSIDGFPVEGLTNVMTTQYRVQASFDFTCPAIHNYVHDFESIGSESCYQNTNGMPYTVHGAASDGVFLMIAPLSVGQHIIHYENYYPGYGLIQDVTHYITAEPVALTVTPGSPSGNLALSWPWTLDDTSYGAGAYILEVSPSLRSPTWQAANLPAVLAGGVYRATVPAGQANQFFRLRLKSP